jgi:hypothetical protein
LAKPAPVRKPGPTTVKASAKFGKFTVLTKPKKQPFFILLYGIEGMGKTSFCAEFPDPLFILHRDEQGLLALMDKGIVDPETPHIGPVEGHDHSWQIESWKDFMSATTEIVHAGSETIIFDSLSAFEPLPYPDALVSHCGNDQKLFYSYGTGTRACEKFYWTLWQKKVNDLRAAGKNVIITAHAQQRPTADPVTGVAFDKYGLRLDRGLEGLITRWADMVLFMHPEYQAEKIAGSIAGKKGKEGGRYIYTGLDPRYTAKSKGLPPFIDMGNSAESAFKNFMDANRKKP